MNKDWIFGVVVSSLFIIGMIGIKSPNKKPTQYIEDKSKPLVPTRKLENGKCLYNSMPGEEFKIIKSYANAAPLFFYYNTKSPRTMQLSQDNYKELLDGGFKIIKTGTQSNPYTLDHDLLIKNNEIEERYNLSIYNRNTTNSTELITSKCYTYFMANNIHKEDVYEILNHPDGSHPSDDELLKLFNKESLHLKEFQTKKYFDRFKRETTLISDSYGGVLLYGEVSDKYRREQNSQSDVFSRKDFNKNEKLIWRLVVYTNMAVDKILSSTIYDTDGNTHNYT